MTAATVPGLLAGKVAVVTGAGSPRGIGRGTATLFAAHGARIAVLDVDGRAADDAAKSLGPGHRGVAVDVRDPTACRQAIAAVVDALGPPDVLAHIAGIVRPTRIGDVSPDEVELVLDVNLKGSINICQAVLASMRPRRAGSIALMSSVAAQRGGGVFGGAHYSASKAGVLGLARAMAREVAADGVRVNAVAPGPVDTDILGGPMSDAQKTAFAAAVPMGRIGTTTDVAGAFLFLASELSAYVTGAVIDVNGGLHIH